jgi:uncharacterized NAD-dependent epimerase/dehydratase family protein
MHQTINLKEKCMANQSINIHKAAHEGANLVIFNTQSLANNPAVIAILGTAGSEIVSKRHPKTNLYDRVLEIQPPLDTERLQKLADTAFGALGEGDTLMCVIDRRESPWGSEVLPTALGNLVCNEPLS